MYRSCDVINRKFTRLFVDGMFNALFLEGLSARSLFAEWEASQAPQSTYP